MFDEKLDFDRIYSDYRPRILGYLTRLAGANEAEDLVQETFIRVGQGLGSFNHQSSLSTWIYQIATNAATDRFRSRTFKREVVTAFEIDPEKGATPLNVDVAVSAADQAVRNEMNDCIQAYVDRLPEKYRAVLVLSQMEELKNAEIAEILGISLQAVKIQLHRAKEKLRQAFLSDCDFYRTDNNQLACEPKVPVKKKRN